MSVEAQLTLLGLSPEARAGVCPCSHSLPHGGATGGGPPDGPTSLSCDVVDKARPAKGHIEYLVLPTCSLVINLG